MDQTLKALVRDAKNFVRLSSAAREERRRDLVGLPSADPGSERVLAALIEWLCLAQDRSRSADGGVARDYSLIRGWATSYPETTGYIIPTLLQYAARSNQPRLRERARRMVDWLTRIELTGGGFQGGKIDSNPVVAVTFNTGQILLGLVAAETGIGGYREWIRRTADWLVETQDSDGCWRRFPTPFAAAGEKCYETHVAWALFEADRVEPAHGYGDAGLANVRWALRHQQSNGWFAKCCLTDPAKPLTHTLGYALRGVLEGYRFSGQRDLLDAARLTADGLLSALREDGYLPGRLRPDWSAAVRWACLTGSAQVAHCWLLLHRHTHNSRYAEAAFRANQYVRRTVRLDGTPDVRGAVKGSFPIHGEYGQYEYPNWAAKFLADSLMLEIDVRSEAAL